MSTSFNNKELNNQGMELLNRFRIAEAVQKFKESIALEHNNAHSHYYLGLAYKSANNLYDATLEFTIAFEIDPNFWEPYYEFALAIDAQRAYDRVDQVIEALKNVIRLNPNFADAHFIIAQFLGYSRQADKAHLEYKKAIELDTINIKYRLKYAEFLFFNGFYLDSINESNEIIYLDEKNIAAWKNVIDCYTSMERLNSGRFEDLHKTLYKYLTNNPKDASIVITKLDFYKKNNSMDKAVSMLQDLITKYPNHHELYSNIGLIFSDLGNTSEAIKVCERAVELDRKNLDYHYRLAGLYCDNGQFEDATIEYNEALFLKPDDPNIKTKLEAIQGKLRYAKREILKSYDGFTVDKNVKSIPDFNKITANPKLDKILEERWKEAILCAENGAYMASATMLGSILEGLLHIMAIKAPEQVGRSKAAGGKTFDELSLDKLINVGHELGWIRDDRKEFGGAVRDYRNLIHPREQMKKGIFPDKHTVSISIAVVRAAIDDLINYVGQN